MNLKTNDDQRMNEYSTILRMIRFSFVANDNLFNKKNNMYIQWNFEVICARQNHLLKCGLFVELELNSIVSGKID